MKWGFACVCVCVCVCVWLRGVMLLYIYDILYYIYTFFLAEVSMIFFNFYAQNYVKYDK